MRSLPSRIELLEAARLVLADKLIPSLPEGVRDEALRVVQAIDIVRRELENDSAAEWGGVPGMLAALYDDEVTGARMLWARLAGDLRYGAFENDTLAHRAALDILREATTRKLAEDNPDYRR